MKKILIADDHNLIRQGVIYILSKTEDLRVSAEASTAEEALEAVRKQPFDLVLLDVIMPGRSGLDIIRELQAEQPGIKVIILSMCDEEQMAIRSFKEGADGFICKKNTEETLIPAIRTVLGGHRFVSREAAQCLIDYLVKGEQTTAHNKLGKREFQVLMLLGAGRTPKEIAEKLGLSVKTVHAHRAHIMEKLGLASTAELVKYVLDNNLV